MRESLTNMETELGTLGLWEKPFHGPVVSFVGARKNRRVRKGAKARALSVGKAVTGNQPEAQCLSLGRVLPGGRSLVGEVGNLHPKAL